MKKNLFLSAGLALMVFGTAQFAPVDNALAYPPPEPPEYRHHRPPPPPPPRMHRDHVRYYEGSYYRRDRDGNWYRSRYEQGPWHYVDEYRLPWLRERRGPPPPPPPHRYPRY